MVSKELMTTSNKMLQQICASICEVSSRFNSKKNHNLDQPFKLQESNQPIKTIMIKNETDSQNRWIKTLNCEKLYSLQYFRISSGTNLKCLLEKWEIFVIVFLFAKIYNNQSPISKWWIKRTWKINKKEVEKINENKYSDGFKTITLCKHEAALHLRSLFYLKSYSLALC